jgi:dihydrolipoamide dehydrogenase
MSGGSGEQVYDVAVIGGGPGGYVAAIRASQLGLKAAVIESTELGGICVNWGCIPSKAILRNADVLTTIAHAKDFGISVGDVTADFGAAIDRCNKIVQTQVRGVNYQMRKNQIDVLRGRGTLVAKDRIAVSGGADGDKEVRARNIIIATGSRVRPLQGVTIDGKQIISAKEIWNVKELPKSLLIIGAGAIGVEFATVFQAYGTEVTIVEFLPRVVPLEDEDLSAELAKQFSRRKIKLLTATKVDSAEVKGDKVVVKISPAPGGQGQAQTLEVDRVLLAAGFLPNSEDLGLEALGVATNRSYITTNEWMQTNVPGVYAIGDVTGKAPMLAHTAYAQAELAAEVIAGHQSYPIDYDAVPRATYSSPQIASIGKTEAQAREGGREIKVGKFLFRPNGKAHALGELDGHMKIVADAQTGEILGAHMVGPEVTEMVGEFALARILEATPTEIARSVHPHPSLSEVIAEAARAVEGLPIHGA